MLEFDEAGDRQTPSALVDVAEKGDFLLDRFSMAKSEPFTWSAHFVRNAGATSRGRGIRVRYRT